MPKPAVKITKDWLRQAARDIFYVEPKTSYRAAKGFFEVNIPTARDPRRETQLKQLLQDVFHGRAVLERSESAGPRHGKQHGGGYRVIVPMRPLEAAVTIIGATKAPEPPSFPQAS